MATHGVCAASAQMLPFRLPLPRKTALAWIVLLPVAMGKARTDDRRPDSGTVSDVRSGASATSSGPVGDDLFARAVRPHIPALSAHLRRFSRNPCVIEDLLQETLMEAYVGFAALRNPACLYSWLRRIASRAGYRFWASQIRHRQAKTAYVELRRQCAPENHGEDIECIEWARRLLARLNPTERMILEMKYLRGSKAVEIASRLGWEPGRVRIRVYRALRKARRFHGMLAFSAKRKRHP